jgi:hypothetical protein
MAGLGLGAPALAVDWNEMVGVNTVTIITTTPEGTPRETTIWLVVLDGFPYVRTGSTRWAGDIAANADVKLDVGGRGFLMRAVPVTDPIVFDKVQRAMREKYGWADVMVGLMPGAGTRVFRLDARPGV